jgi:hypothetical protein
MKMVTRVGARPQFIKAAMVSRALAAGAEEVIIHTGQFFDANMSDVFFDKLKIPRPARYLGIGGSTLGEGCRPAPMHWGIWLEQSTNRGQRIQLFQQPGSLLQHAGTGIWHRPAAGTVMENCVEYKAIS